MRIAWRILGGTLALALCGQAKAQPQVVTLPTVVQGASPADRTSFQRALDDCLDRGIKKTGRMPRLPGPLTGAELSCRGADCMARIAEATGPDAAIVLGAVVAADRGSPPSFKITLTRFDRDRPGVIRQETQECSVCTPAETADRLERMVPMLLPSVNQQPQLAKPLPNASANANANANPNRAPSPTPNSTAAPSSSPSPPSDRSPDAAASPPARSRTILYAGLGIGSALAAGGLAMIGVGAQAIAIDGQPTSTPAAPATQAPQVYDTHSTGVGLVAGGSFLVVAAAVGIGIDVWLLRRERGSR